MTRILLATASAAALFFLTTPSFAAPTIFFTSASPPHGSTQFPHFFATSGFSASFFHSASRSRCACPTAPPAPASSPSGCCSST